ncbi:MAG TPA: hypothetical protein VI636_24870 [Candidatus Angelobacter sp.]
MKTMIRAILFILVLSAHGLYAQVAEDQGDGPPSPSGPSAPGPTNPTGISSTGSGTVNTAWGYYIWQVDQSITTTTLTSETGFNTPPGLVQIPVTLPSSTTIHEVHGNISFGVFQGGTCGVGSIIAQVRDQNQNVIAAVDLIQFGQSSANVSIKGTFGTSLAVTSLQLQFDVDQCGAQVASWSLTMS